MKTQTIYAEYIALMQDQVCERLGFNKDALSEQMYICGIKFLHIKYPDHCLMRELLEKDALFWRWWKLEWHRRDEMFMDDSDVYAATQWRQLLIYIDFNDPDKLAKNMVTPRVVTLGISKLLKRSDGTQ